MQFTDEHVYSLGFGEENKGQTMWERSLKAFEDITTIQSGLRGYVSRKQAYSLRMYDTSQFQFDQLIRSP